MQDETTHPFDLSDLSSEMERTDVEPTDVTQRSFGNLSMRLQANGVRLRSETGAPLLAARAPAKPTWAQLLAAPEGSYVICRETVAALRGTTLDERVIPGTDQALAALIALWGASAVRPLLADLDATRLADQLAARAMRVRAMLSTCAFLSIAETTGVSLADVDPTVLDVLVEHDGWSRGDRNALALVCLLAGRPELAYGRVDAAAGEPSALISALLGGKREAIRVGWEATLRAFPQQLAERRNEWRCLVLAARVVLPIVDGVQSHEIADALHARIWRQN